MKKFLWSSPPLADLRSVSQLQACPGTDCLNMTIAIDRDVTPQTKQTKKDYMTEILPLCYFHLVNLCCFRERSGSVVECLTRPRGRGFKPHRRHCVVVLEQDTFILA